ncbi:MAG: cation:proton antiporter [Myxococcota bacterium]
MGLDFLPELLGLLAAATATAALFERLRLPSIAAFLVVGVAVGPGGLGWVSDPEVVREIAELGVVFLLFEIGLELPIERLRRFWKPALLAGGLQVTLTLGVVAALASGFGLPLREALVLGALIAMSSTALVMRMLGERGELDAPHGQLAIGILLFQDLCVVPFLLAVPILAAGPEAGGTAILVAFGRALAALVLFAAVARFVLPTLLDRFARIRSREIFTMAAFLAVLGSAVVAEEIGLTLSVGAFMGGLVLSMSPYAHQLFAEVVPLRGVLLAVFFTAVGMLFDPAVAWEQAGAVFAYAAGVVVLKAGFIALILAGVLRLGVRLGVLTGLWLAQTGEFSFVLSGVAAAAGLLDPTLGQIFVAGSILTLVATPFLVAAAPRIAGGLGAGLERRPDPEAPVEERGHVVLVGFGLAGRNIARVLRSRQIPYRAVDTNAAAVREAAARGEPVVYGDATRSTLLAQVDVRDARLVVLALADAAATLEVVRSVRRLTPDVPIVARTRFVLDVDRLAESGASTVVVEEFESTLELLAETLRQFNFPEESILRFASELRDEGYVFLRETETILDPWLTDLLEEVTSDWVEIPHGFHAGLDPATLASLAIREDTGASVVAVERDGSTQVSPPANYALHSGDRLLVVGEPAALERLRKLFDEDD